MITASDVARVASETGFRAEVVEKVLRLRGILGRLDQHEITQGTWLLKGGTALNLLHLDVPRLSVDIDVNYVGADDVEGMRRSRPDFERALTSCCAREGCDVRRAPSEHAGGKFRMRYPSVLGGSQNLEVDVSYVARVPMWGSIRAKILFPSDSELHVPTLTLEELAAGKFAALAQREAARDAFDAANLFTLMPDLVQRPIFRIAFVCFAAGSRTDARQLQRADVVLSDRMIEQDLDPLIRRDRQGIYLTVNALREWIIQTVEPALSPLWPIAAKVSRGPRTPQATRLTRKTSSGPWTRRLPTRVDLWRRTCASRRQRLLADTMCRSSTSLPSLRRTSRASPPEGAR